MVSRASYLHNGKSYKHTPPPHTHNHHHQKKKYIVTRPYMDFIDLYIKIGFDIQRMTENQLHGTS